MLGVGLFVVWVGYSLAYYGVDQIRGGNNGLLSLMVPGKFTNQRTDAGSSQSAIAAYDSAASVALEKLQGSQAAANAAAAPGGKNQSGGTGTVQGPGGVTVVYGPSGQVTCLDSKGNIVPCPAGTG